MRLFARSGLSDFSLETSRFPPSLLPISSDVFCRSGVDAIRRISLRPSYWAMGHPESSYPKRGITARNEAHKSAIAVVKSKSFLSVGLVAQVSASPLFARRPFTKVRMYAAGRSGKMNTQKKKRRLDEICLERFQQYSRTYIQSWILQGKVFVDGRVVNKAGTPVSDKAVVEIRAEVPKYVCRGGYKLEAAIEQFAIDVAGKIALDSGLSTGGFTDCLLQYGAAFVYGVDVGYGQVADKIRQDRRVSVIERTNLRYLTGLPQKVDVVTLDLSFISILLVMPAVLNVMKDESILVTLVKPQFEAHRSQVGGGGIVRDQAVHHEVLERIIKGVEGFGFSSKGWIESPLKGAEGNTEFLVCFCRNLENKLCSEKSNSMLQSVKE